MLHQQGDYYVECPWTEHALFYWSPILALAGILLSSLAVPVDIDRSTRRSSKVLEAVVGIEGTIIAFGTLLAPWIPGSIPGLLGYPNGRRVRSERSSVASLLARCSWIDNRPACLADDHGRQLVGSNLMESNPMPEHSKKPDQATSAEEVLYD